MVRFILLLSLIPYSLMASTHLETVCLDSLQAHPTRANAQISNPPSFASNHLVRRVIEDGKIYYALESLQGERIFESSNQLIAIEETQNELWVLANHELLEISFTGEVKESHPIVFNPAPNEAKARAMTRADDLLLVARGSGGLTAFNILNKKIQWHSELAGVDGAVPVAVTFDGKNAQVIMTGTREGGFNGVATVSLHDGAVIGQMPYNQRRAGVIFPYAKARWSNDKLILNNGGWIHLITAKQIADGKPIKPVWRAVEVGDDMHLHYMMLSGEFFVRDNVLYGCGTYNERSGGDSVRAARLFEVNL